MSQVVVVTGASAGVGRAVVRAYARRGARIGLLARGRERLAAARREVEAAEAVLWAADHRRTEVHVGGSTVAVIWGSKLFPRLGDLYLARTGFESQQTAEPEDPARPHNLWEPVPGDPGAHGDFGHRAHGWSAQFALSRRRRWLAAGGAVAAAVWAIARARRAA